MDQALSVGHRERVQPGLLLGDSFHFEHHALSTATSTSTSTAITATTTMDSSAEGWLDGFVVPRADGIDERHISQDRQVTHTKQFAPVGEVRLVTIR